MVLKPFALNCLNVNFTENTRKVSGNPLREVDSVTKRGTGNRY